VTTNDISKTTYGANDNPKNPGEGSGQGSSSSIMLWLTTEEVILEAY